MICNRRLERIEVLKLHRKVLKKEADRYRKAIDHTLDERTRKVMSMHLKSVVENIEQLSVKILLLERDTTPITERTYVSRRARKLSDGGMVMHYGKCWKCGKMGWLEDHHIFGSYNRKKSEKYGLKVGLCGDTCHRNGEEAAHQCAATAQALHEYGQRKFMEEQGATVDEFRALFGKNYL